MIARAVGIALMFASLTSMVPDLAPSTVASGSTEILVTNASDIVNGEVETVVGLRRRPGRDGISLREAIEATNYDPGRHAIRFEPSLAGAVIEVGERLPGLTGGNVDMGGDIDGNGRPDITIRAIADIDTGLHLASSGNRLSALELEGFGRAVAIGPPSEPAVVGQSFTDTMISGLVIHDVEGGINLDSGMSACESPCDLDYRWSNITVSGNMIDAERNGIFFFVARTGDRVQGVTIVDNTIRISGTGLGPGINVETAGESTGASISDVLIARNTVKGSPDTGIQVGAGGNRAQEGVLEHVQIVDNRLLLHSQDRSLCCSGIVVEAGSDTAESAIGPPVRYLDDNVVRDVVIRGNSIEGDLSVAIHVQAGQNGGARNRIDGLVVEAKVVRSTRASLFGTGTYVVIAESDSYLDRAAGDNEIANVAIRGNALMIAGTAEGGDCGEILASAIALVGGGESGRGNEIHDVVIEDNTIDITYTAIAIIGGMTSGARDNAVRDVRIGPNVVSGGTDAVAVIDNCMGASGNSASASIDPLLMPVPEPSPTPSPVNPATPSPTPSPGNLASASPTPDAGPGEDGSGDAPWLGWAAAVALVGAVLAVAVLRVRRTHGPSR